MTKNDHDQNKLSCPFSKIDIVASSIRCTLASWLFHPQPAMNASIYD